MRRIGALSFSSVSRPFKHVLSHQTIFAKFWEVNNLGNKLKNDTKNFVYVIDNQLNKYAFPRLIELYFEEQKAKKQ